MREKSEKEGKGEDIDCGECRVTIVTVSPLMTCVTLIIRINRYHHHYQDQ